ncbi:MAG: hypothetical protein SGPRY_012215 [Prymnesium sp.]
MGSSQPTVESPPATSHRRVHSRTRAQLLLPPPACPRLDDLSRCHSAAVRQPASLPLQAVRAAQALPSPTSLRLSLSASVHADACRSAPREKLDWRPKQSPPTRRDGLPARSLHPSSRASRERSPASLLSTRLASLLGSCIRLLVLRSQGFLRVRFGRGCRFQRPSAWAAPKRLKTAAFTRLRWHGLP